MTLNTPPLLLAASLLFWGSQSAMLWAAIPLAVILEGSRLLATRWDLSRTFQHRVSDVSTAALAVAAIYLYTTRDPVEALTGLLTSLPLFLAPLALAQAYGSKPSLDAGAFFWSLRREGAPAWPLAIDWPLFAACVLAAGAANVRTSAFFAGLCALSAWALWTVRPRSTSLAAWVALLALAGGLGHAGHVGLHALQPIVEKRGAELLFGVWSPLKDASQSATAIGTIGALKRSDAIALRVSRPSPSLLRNASYDLYVRGDWLLRDAKLREIGPGGGDWVLAPGRKGAHALAVTADFSGGYGALALPSGAARIEGLPATSAGLNRMGSVVIDGAPRRAEFTIRYDPDSTIEPAPGPQDLAVPESNREAFSRLAATLPKKDKVPAVERFFADGFSYSLGNEGPYKGDPVDHFILRSRSGHCEFFATATVLLLRAAGVPARYATGFSVQEFSRLEGAFIVRQRHAHAWARAFVNGRWVDVDTTPASWAEQEAAQAWALEPLQDLMSWLRLSFGRVFNTRVSKRSLLFLLFPLGAYAAWRLRRGFSGLRMMRAEAEVSPTRAPGLDSEFFDVERALAASGLGRRPWEPVQDWVRRVGPQAKGPDGAERLAALAALHDRYRFDPKGLDDEERNALRAAVRAWLAPR